MPQKTRILDGEDEYLFVDTPGDHAGPALFIFARPDNRRAVASGRTATHQSEHGAWCTVARFADDTLSVWPDSPQELGGRLKALLPRYVEARAQRIRGAEPQFWYLAAGGLPVHLLHPAQPAGLMLRLWSDEGAARAAAAAREEGDAVAVRPTGELREFLGLRAEEGFAAVLLDDRDVVFFFLDEGARFQFLKLSAPAGSKEVASHLLGEKGEWVVYEGDENLDPLVAPDLWDRLMIRALGEQPFVGHQSGRAYLYLERDAAPVTVKDPEGDGVSQMLPIFSDAASAEAYRREHRLGAVRIAPAEDLVALVRGAQDRGAITRLQPGDHRARAAALWCDEEGIVLDSYSGLWRSRDGKTFESIE